MSPIVNVAQSRFVPRILGVEEFSRETEEYIERERVAAIALLPASNDRQASGSIKIHWHRDADPNNERAWLVRDLIGESGKGLLSGQWGSAKTFMALELSRCIMTGDAFAGRRVLRRGGVLFIAPEGASELPIRLRGLVAARITGADLVVRPDDLPFAWIEECPRLVDPQAVEILERCPSGLKRLAV